jgi:uncharacterized protein (TIGR02452 family)
MLTLHYPVGMNMANAYTKGGGVLQGCRAQEEHLMRRSNAYKGLETVSYPLGEVGGVYSGGVMIFREDGDGNKGYDYMRSPVEVALVATAAFDLRPGSTDLARLGLNPEDVRVNKLRACPAFMDKTREKLRNCLRSMASHGHTEIVLGAIGCGAFGTPPEVISEIYAELFNEAEFKGRFKRVIFAILNKSAVDAHNVEVFTQMCHRISTVGLT